nr:hypothetical protein GCM10023233_17070 [Brevibacterium otitidis]
MGEAADDSSSGDALLTALVAPVVWIEHAAFENRAVGVDRLSSRGQAEPVELTERIEIGRSEGSVGHVEVFQMVSVRTSIFGRPRCLSPDRRAHTAIDRYTLICEEPEWLFRVECGHAGRAGVLGISVEVPDDEWALTPADLKDLDNA